MSYLYREACRRGAVSAAVLLTLCAAHLAAPQYAACATAPFVEAFSADAADWADVGSLPLDHVAVGGVDAGGFVRTEVPLADVGGGAGGTDVVLFRAHDEFGASGSSGGAFIGNWIADGVGRLSAWVRHDAALPLNYFFRGSGPFNFPGGTAVSFTPVLPHVWTEVVFDVTADSNQFVTFEGTSHATVFSNVGHVQLGVTIPAALSGDPTPVTFDLDRVALRVPEPASWLTIALSAGWCCCRRPKRGEVGI